MNLTSIEWLQVDMIGDSIFKPLYSNDQMTSPSWTPSSSTGQ